jgi:hypothetical protein
MDSCTAQTLRDYGGYISDGEPVHRRVLREAIICVARHF